MYIGIDVGGTKTIVACLDDNGVIVESTKLPTPSDYEDFLENVKNAIANFKDHNFTAGSVGVPGVIDRVKEIATNLPNLTWRNVKVASDLERIIGCPMFMENDAKLGGLSEAMLVKEQFMKVLYVTISTGIGYALINNLAIDKTAGDSGGRIMLVKRGRKLVSWESLASGRAIVERYGKMAKDIDDQETWQKICKDIAEGLEELIAVFQPDVIIFGGSVGYYFNKYGLFLEQELSKYDLPLLKVPALKGAERANEAVIYGCYDYAKQRLSK